MNKIEKIAIVIAVIIGMLPIGCAGYIGYKLSTLPITAKLGKKFNNWLDER